MAVPEVDTRGMAADLVWMGADPAADVHSVRKVAKAMKDGRVDRP